MFTTPKYSSILEQSWHQSTSVLSLNHGIRVSTIIGHYRVYSCAQLQPRNLLNSWHQVNYRIRFRKAWNSKSQINRLLHASVSPNTPNHYLRAHFSVWYDLRLQVILQTCSIVPSLHISHFTWSWPPTGLANCVYQGHQVHLNCRHRAEYATLVDHILEVYFYVQHDPNLPMHL